MTTSSTTPFSLIDSNTLGFNGYPYDGASGTYLLGNGYRAYNPRLRTFHSRDSLSPFGGAGINRYHYCHLDPINFTDPSGHINAYSGVGIGLGVLGVILGIVTFGAAIALIAGGAVVAGVIGVVGGVLGIVSAATGIASSALEESHPEIANSLFWVSLSTGLASAVLAMGSYNALRAMGRAAMRAPVTLTPGSRLMPFARYKPGVTAFPGSRAGQGSRLVRGTVPNYFGNTKNSPLASQGGRINTNYQLGFAAVTSLPYKAFASLDKTVRAILVGELIASGSIAFFSAWMINRHQQYYPEE
ncbi:RHS repeat-associated core domain-containing protein [Pseudomonas sp. 6D_7.1_Bac1]|uniref:RHS repeat-associated core domain-containing protein n=1 Tax=Pseudomonas sp. 6D_7.1_Bac1 TaxID=2971615 RepID=UPI0021C605D4|nr:RHS repeat-associated core domain-containing protein [Pseudomonas sp. 6D_7.1_Bac1]MCU1752770.1 RHS repeat-associated core domain-containing protein [Pseudomonas sp. 6D_7.1_Bac1]